MVQIKYYSINLLYIYIYVYYAYTYIYILSVLLYFMLKQTILAGFCCNVLYSNYTLISFDCESRIYDGETCFLTISISKEKESATYFIGILKLFINHIIITIIIITITITLLFYYYYHLLIMITDQNMRVNRFCETYAHFVSISSSSVVLTTVFPLSCWIS